MKSKFIVLLLNAMIAISSATAQIAAVVPLNKPDWQKIGETNLNFKTNRDIIIVTNQNKFDAIQFKIQDAPINIINLEIFYESDDIQYISVAMPIQISSASTIVDLRGGSRFIKKVIFSYNALPKRKDTKAHLELWGMKSVIDKI